MKSIDMQVEEDEMSWYAHLDLQHYIHRLYFSSYIQPSFVFSYLSRASNAILQFLFGVYSILSLKWKAIFIFLMSFSHKYANNNNNFLVDG